MKHTIPYRFIATFLTLCLCALCIYRPLSAKSTLSSALPIPIGTEKKVHIAAYDTQYYYFEIPTSYQPNKQKISIVSFAKDVELQLSALDCNGAPLPLKTSGSTYELSGNLSASDRCFLRLHNSRQTEQTATLSISCISVKAASPKTTSDRRNTKPKKTNTPSANNNKKKSASNKTLHTDRKKKQSPKSYISQRYQKPMYQNRTPVPTSNPSSVTRKPTKKNNKCSSSPTVSPATVLPSPETHFVRLQQGTSLFLTERLFKRVPEEHITIIPSSPSISVNNGIVYVPKDGLYYLTIRYGNKHSSCTILVTPK